MRQWLIIAGLVMAADQLSKHGIASALQVHDYIEVMPFFNLVLAHNTGAAFSFLAEGSGWQRWFFVVLALVVSAVIVRWLQKLTPGERWSGVGLSLILGGALGNVIDRVFLGHVIDFIDVYYTAATCLPLFSPVPVLEGMECHWPAFNIADSAISVGAVMMVIDSFRNRRTQP